MTAPTLTAADIRCWPDSPPVVPPSSWSTHVFPMRDCPGLWTVTARRGSRILNIGRLTTQDVTGFDPEARWHRQ